MKENVLVTGGAGFIGSALVRELVRRSCHVHVLDNLSFGRKKFLPRSSRMIFHKADLRHPSQVEKLVKSIRPHRVFHLAALHFIPYCDAHPEETVDVNVMGTRHLLEALEHDRPEVLFYASTAAVYPPSRAAHKETDGVGSGGIYGTSKLIGEDLVRLFHAKVGVRCVIGRIFNAFGPNETNPHLVPALVDQLRRGKRKVALGNLSPRRDFIHTSDLVAAIARLACDWKGDIDVFNIGSGRAYSVRQIVDTCEKVLGEKIVVRQKKNLIRRVDRPHLQANITKIQRCVDWSPRVSLEEGLRGLLS